MRHFIYLDESGEASFSEQTAFPYFSITTMTINEQDKKKIKNILRRAKAKLYKRGWPRAIEIKASILHGLQHHKEIPERLRNEIDGDKFIKSILEKLESSCRPRIDYIVVKKDGFTNPTFKAAPYGIAYNFLAGKILFPLIRNMSDCFLTVDKRNKETHSQKHFDGYIKTTVIGDAYDKRKDIVLQIKHEESHSNTGLQAVDFFCWSINRKMQNRDSRFFDVFTDLVETAHEWYC